MQKEMEALRQMLEQNQRELAASSQAQHDMLDYARLKVDGAVRFMRMRKGHA